MKTKQSDDKFKFIRAIKKAPARGLQSCALILILGLVWSVGFTGDEGIAVQTAMDSGISADKNPYGKSDEEAKPVSESVIAPKEEEVSVLSVFESLKSEESADDKLLTDSVNGRYIAGKDYLQEGRDRLGLYEEFGLDPCAPTYYEPGEMGQRLKRLAGLNEDFKYLYEHQWLYPWGLLAATCNYPEMIDFTVDYPDHETEDKRYTEDEMKQDFPHLLQWDRRWGYLPYGQNCIAISGCAPTCLAMVSLALTRNPTVTPDVVGDYAMKKNYHIPGTGTKWALLVEGAKDFGLEVKTVPMKEQEVVSELEKGHPIICSMQKGYFTSKGHFIVLVGVENGKIKVNDPNSIARSEMEWEFQDIRKQAKNMWSYSLAGTGVAGEVN